MLGTVEQVAVFGSLGVDIDNSEYFLISQDNNISQKHASISVLSVNLI